MHFVVFLITLPSNFKGLRSPQFELVVSELFSGFIYVIGGISDEGMELRSAEMYDPISRRWSALPVMVTRRAYVGVACLNNCIYAVGGWNEALGALETVEKYCPEEVKLGRRLLVIISLSFIILALVFQPYLWFKCHLHLCRRNGWRSLQCRRPVQACRFRRWTAFCTPSGAGPPAGTSRHQWRWTL